MISRQWRGLARKESAAAYVEHLRSETFPSLGTLPGFVSASILRREVVEGVEFLIVTNWKSLDSIRGFAGSNPDVVVPQKVCEMMLEFDHTVRHFEIVEAPP